MRAKGSSSRVHEHPAHHLDDDDPSVFRRLVKPDAAAGRARGIVAGPQQAVLVVDEGEDLLPVPGVIPGRDRVHAGIEELVADIAGDPETAGRVLAVGDHEVEAQLLPQGGNVLAHDLPPRAAHHVAYEQEFHGNVLAETSVTTQSRRSSVSSRGTASTSCPA